MMQKTEVNRIKVINKDKRLTLKGIRVSYFLFIVDLVLVGQQRII